MILQGSLSLVERQDVARDTLRLRFEVAEGLTDLSGNAVDKPFSFTPGQFVSLRFNETSWRAYSIASLPKENLIELVVRLVEGGVASEAFRVCQPGDTFAFKGPFGHFVLSDTDDAELVFCATGTGIAPLRSMILAEAEKASPRPMTLYYGGRHEKDIAYLDEVSNWSPDLKIHLAFSQEVPDIHEDTDSVIHEGRITNALSEAPLSPKTEYYLCGNGDMVKDVAALLDEKGIEKEKVFMERFN